MTNELFVKQYWPEASSHYNGLCYNIYKTWDENKDDIIGSGTFEKDAWDNAKNKLIYDRQK